MEALTIGLFVIGLAFLLFGYQLYLLLVALFGFGLGGGITYSYFAIGGASTDIQLLLTVIVGAIAAIVFVFIQRFLVALPGFFLGAWIGRAAAFEYGLGDFGTFALVVILAIFGAGLALYLFKSIMIVLTSFAGTSVLTFSITVDDLRSVAETQSLDPIAFDMTGAVFLLVFAFGILFQFGVMSMFADDDDSGTEYLSTYMDR